jgi:hypothetical protein
MPDRKGRRGEVFSLYAEKKQASAPGALAAFALAGGVVLAALALKWAWFALHISFPGR